MATVYLLQMTCGDYYCNDQHPAGVYSTEDLARVALGQALELPMSKDIEHVKAYASGTVLKIELDAAPTQRPDDDH